MARFNKFPLVSMFALSMALPAFAQTPASQPAEPAPQTAPPAEEERGGNVIVVTANKRQESVQDVAVAVTAITAEAKEELGIISVTDLTNVTPGLAYTPGNERVTLRGIGRQTNSAGADPGIANYNDGIYTSFAVLAGKDPILIDRVEVLRGPQGTLYGRNSIGGAINTISKRPTDEFELDTTIGASDFEGRKIAVAASGPITDWLRYRAAGLRESREGINYNYGSTEYEGWEIDDGYLEFQLEGDIGDRFSWWLMTTDSNYHKAGPPGGRTATFSTAPFISSGVFSVSTGQTPIASWAYSGNASIIGFQQGGTRRDNPFATDREHAYNVDTVPEADLQAYDAYIAEGVYSFDDFDLKYIGGYTYFDYHLYGDADGTAVKRIQYRAIAPSIAACNPLVGQPITASATCAGFGQTIRDMGTDYRNEYNESRAFFSNEINLISTNDSPLQWILGLYGFQENNDQSGLDTHIVNEPGANGTPEMVNGTFSSAGKPIFKSRAKGLQNSYGAYARGDYDFNDQLRFSLGLRYSIDNKKAVEQGITNCYIVCRAFKGLLNGTTPGTPAGTFNSDLVNVTPLVFAPTLAGISYDAEGYANRVLKNQWSMVTGDLGVEFRPLDDTLLFAKYSKGYKSGGINTGFAVNSNTNSEKAYVYEGGWKQEWSDFNLTTNAAAFFYDYRDVQASVTRVINQGIVGQERTVGELANLPKATSMGFEVESQWNPIDALNINFSYSYLKTEITNGGGIYINSAKDTRSAVVGGVIVYNDPTSQVLLEGNELPQSPHNKIALSATYKFEFDDGSTFLPAVSYYWRDKFYDSIFNDPNEQAPTQKQTDVRGTWRSGDDHYTLIFWGRNVFDEEQNTSVAANGFRTADSGRYQTFSYAPPRMFGVDFQFHY